MFKARWLCLGWSLRTSLSALALLTAVNVMAASESPVQIQGFDLRSGTGGVEFFIHTTSRPLLVDANPEAPGQFTVKLASAAFDFETLPFLDLRHELFKSIDIIPLQDSGVQVNFELHSPGKSELQVSDEGVLISFVQPSEEKIAASVDVDTNDIEIQNSVIAASEEISTNQSETHEIVAELVEPIVQGTKIDFRELEEAPMVENYDALRDSYLIAQNQSDALMNKAQASAKIDQQSVEYTGAPINLDLKAIDIVEVLRIFSDLSSMNIIIDPGIKGKVTVKMRDVPWDQAFITILRNQGLGFSIDGNIVRVATLRKLDAELRAQAKLRDSQMLTEPLATEIVYLNYATPAQVQKILKTQMSSRGRILTDTRTNSLILRDVRENLVKIKRMVEILDVRTKQITVNAQIVSASKSFTRDLGIAWGAAFEASPRFGNDTGLSFPNDITTEFGVQLPAGNELISFQVGNLLDNFNLDVVLAASEAEGLTKTVSNPRVTTSDNVSASVRSGQIIPYQSSTLSGDGSIISTVIFREAAVSLSVTPHVTSDNYVQLKLTVSSDAPNFDVATPAGPPIRTNSLNTTVLVKDGDTFVIGGLNQSQEGQNANKTPFFHRLPVLGNLFKNKRTVNAYTDLLMFVTPTVVQTESVEQKSLLFETYDVNKSDTAPKTP